MLKVAIRTRGAVPRGPSSTPPCSGGRTPGSRLCVQPSDREEIRDLLKRVAVALKQGDVPFALCGGYAAWVRGAPEPDHDADFLVPAAESERAAKVLAEAGLEVLDPAAVWLTKVGQGGSVIASPGRTGC